MTVFRTRPPAAPAGAALAIGAAATAVPGRALAHASDQALVLLLPTDIYIAAGAAAVALTVLLLAVLPDRTVGRLFVPLALAKLPRRRGRLATSLMSAALLLLLILAGLSGSHDPLKNPLPLFVWTLFWVGFVTLQGLVGDLWGWVNPWTGPAAALRAAGLRPRWRLPRRLDHWPALVLFAGFGLFLLADPAPADPERLARLVGFYWLATLAAVALFGRRWLVRAEAMTVFLRAYARIGLVGRAGSRLGIGLWGWKTLAAPVPPLALAVFMVAMLGSGSFDGLNETFWWLAQLGVNPLEFPGRSAVVVQNSVGLIAANCALVAVFALSVRLGLALAGSQMPAGLGFRAFAPTLLPIALGYHIAHYLTAFLVDGQYALAAASDPLGRGADLLGLGDFHVTTGFFNTPDSVRLIWLSQAAAVVIGHILAVLLAHATAVRAFGSRRSAALSQAPLALFMVAYTFFGLWLLASPRGA